MIEMKNKYIIDKYQPADYIDSYSRDVIAGSELSAEKYFDKVFGNFPRWITALLHLRNILVKPFGIDTEKRFADSIIEKTDRELIFGMKDSHLTFYGSIWCSDLSNGTQELKFTTIVKYHNRVGRIYFTLIKPFHKLIVKHLLNRL